MLRIPLYLAVAQWALLGALGILVVVLFRQLGRLMRASGAGGSELGPPLGSQATSLTYTRPGEQSARRLVPGAGQPALVAFVDPTCPSCEQLVQTLDAMAAGRELAGVRVLLLISDPASYLQISEAFSATALEIGRPADRAGLDFYRVSGTPLLVAVDGAGTVRAAGSVARAPEVRRYLAACTEQGSASARLAPPTPVEAVAETVE